MDRRILSPFNGIFSFQNFSLAVKIMVMRLDLKFCLTGICLLCYNFEYYSIFDKVLKS